MSEWQLIETAPTDGTPIWAYLFDSGIRKLRYWSEDQIAENLGGSPADYSTGWYEWHDSDAEWGPKFWLPIDVIPEPPMGDKSTLSLLSYSGIEFTVENTDGTRRTISADKKQKEILANLLAPLFNEDEDHNVHSIYHSLAEVKTGKGYEYMQSVEKWADEHPDVIQVSVDDDHHAGSDLYLIPHRSKYRHMGVSIFYIPQCTGEAPIKFFCYPGHLDALIDGLTRMRAHLNEVPENDTSSPSYRRGLKLTAQLLATVEASHG